MPAPYDTNNFDETTSQGECLRKVSVLLQSLSRRIDRISRDIHSFLQDSGMEPKKPVSKVRGTKLPTEYSLQIASNKGDSQIGVSSLSRSLSFT